jgi:hypothetical protein
MFSKTSIDFPQKVSVALDMLSELKHGKKYDAVYGTKLKRVRLSSIPEEVGPLPIVIDDMAQDGEVVLQNPSTILQEFMVDHCNWTQAEKDVRSADRQMYDKQSDWYVILWCNHKRWNQAPYRGTISIGLTQLPKESPVINSYDIKILTKGWSHAIEGHSRVLLPKVLTPKSSHIRLVK